MVTGGSSQNGTLFSGNKFQVTQYNHAHHASNNQIVIKNVKPDTEITQTTQTITATDTVVAIADTSSFATFNGITTSTGEALIGDEIVTYTLADGSLTIRRAQLDTNSFPHPEGTDIQTYEASGVSLVGINTTHTITSDPIDIDTYYLEVDRSIYSDPTRNFTTCLLYTSPSPRD